MKIFRLPEAEKIADLNDPSTTEIHRSIIKNKTFLRRVYIDFYGKFKKALPANLDGEIVEIGSGAGFLKEIIPNVVTSELFPVPGIDMVISGMKLPFEKNSIKAFLLLNVLHHIPNPRSFFNETVRCLKKGGKIIMIEPAATVMGSFIWKFHNEPFDKKSSWDLQNEGRLTGANGAMPWIIFIRDRKIFESEYPVLKIVKISFHTPSQYLLSGGLSYKQLLPSFSYDIVRVIEKILSPLNRFIGMFMTIELEKICD